MRIEWIDDLYNNNDLSWSEIKVFFPCTYKEMRSWNFSTDLEDDNHPYDLWFDDQKMYEFFDKINVQVCPIPNMNNLWTVTLYTNGVPCASSERDFEDRTEAEFYGFIMAFEFSEPIIKNAQNEEEIKEGN